MFLDNVQSQSNSQNTNVAYNITIGSTGTDFGQFAPTNKTSAEFKSSNDLGLSAAIGAGSQSGSVGMSRGETIAKEETSYDGYTSTKTSDDKNDTYVLIGIVIAVLVSIASYFKKKK